MIKRIKNILISPKNEWEVVVGENTPHLKLFTTYVLPLSLISAIAAFIGYGLIGYSVFGIRFHSIQWGVCQAMVQWLSMVVGVYVTAFVIDILAANFGTKKDFNKSFSLVAYSYTPVFLSGIFCILPLLSWMSFFVAIYGLFLLFIGLQPMTKVPAEKKIGYLVVSLVVMFANLIVLPLIFGAIFHWGTII